MQRGTSHSLIGTRRQKAGKLHSKVICLNFLIDDNDECQFNTRYTASHPNEYIVSSVDELLELFDADFVSLVVNGGIKMFGKDCHQEVVMEVARYLQQRRFGWVVS